MIDLKKYLCESMVMEAFDKVCLNSHNISLVSHLNINKIKHKKIGELNKLIDQETTPCLYSEGDKYFKMNYQFGAQILNIFKDDEDFKITPNDPSPTDKFSVYYNVGKPLKILEMGRGSVGRIKTKTQEEATCILFNAYIKSIKDGATIDLFNDVDKICNILKVLGDDINNSNDSWYTSWANQIIGLVKFIESFGGNPVDYRLARYGGKSTVSTVYTNMIKNYIRIVSPDANFRIVKDVYDPSDVILYNINKVGNIKKYCLVDKDWSMVRSTFFEKLFLNDSCIGVSLKKLSKDARIERINVGEDKVAKVDSINKLDNESNESNLTISCKGEYGFEAGVEKEILVTMREFSRDGTVAVDIKLPSGSQPTLGKCPANIWRNLLNIDKSEYKNIKACISKFEKNIGNVDILKSIIKGALKEGETCFPYVLLY